MLSQGYMGGAPLYRYTGQVGPWFENSGSLVDWKWCHSIMVKADIHLRPLQTSMWDIYKVFESLLFCLKVIWVYPYTVTLAKLVSDWPRFGNSGSLVEWKWCHCVMFEADIHLRSLHTSILDIYKVWGSLLCCLNGIWMHPYTMTLAKLTLDLGSHGHLWIGNDAIVSWLRLISTSNHFKYPY